MKLTGLVVLLAFSGPAAAGGDDWRVDWYTVDGGGEMFSSDASETWELSGTLAQWDATEPRQLSGGEWKLTGGFWAWSLEELADLLFSDRFEQP